jgi:hypothetical protein
MGKSKSKMSLKPEVATCLLAFNQVVMYLPVAGNTLDSSVGRHRDKKA